MILVFLIVLIFAVLLSILWVKTQKEQYIDMVPTHADESQINSQAFDIVVSQEKMLSDMTKYKDLANQRFNTVEGEQDKLQMSLSKQVTDIANTKLVDSEIFNQYKVDTNKIADKSASTSNWVHIVNGEAMIANAALNQQLDNLFITHTNTSSNVENLYLIGINESKKLTNDINTAFTLLSTQINDNYKKTYTDLNDIETSLSQNRDSLNNDITKLINTTNTLHNDVVTKGTFNGFITETNTNIGGIKNDYVPKATYNGTFDTLQNKFNEYPSLQAMTNSYWSIKSSQEIETSLKNIDSKITAQKTINTNPDYVLKSTLTNNYYDKSGVDNALTSKTNGYLTTKDADTQYYPVASAQKIDSILKGFDTTISTQSASGTIVNTTKVCVGKSCLDETALINTMIKNNMMISNDDTQKIRDLIKLANSDIDKMQQKYNNRDFNGVHTHLNPLKSYFTSIFAITDRFKTVPQVIDIITEIKGVIERARTLLNNAAQQSLNNDYAGADSSRSARINQINSEEANALSSNASRWNQQRQNYNTEEWNIVTTANNYRNSQIGNWNWVFRDEPGRRQAEIDRENREFDQKRDSAANNKAIKLRNCDAQQQQEDNNIRTDTNSRRSQVENEITSLKQSYQATYNSKLNEVRSIAPV